MPEMTFQALQDKVFALHREGAYSEALSLIEQHADALAQHAVDLYYWRACLACRAGDPDAGLAWLQEACDRGLWYHDSILRDPDLAPLRESGRLEPLQKVFRERHAAAQAQARPELRVWSPDGPRRGLLLALHGAGWSAADEAELLRWRPALEAGWQVAAAQSSQMCGPGKYFWHDRALGIAEVRRHLEALEAPDHTVVAGFSAGAGVALQGVLSGALPAVRFLAVAPAIRSEVVLPMVETCRPDVRGYVVIGEKDWCWQAAVELTEAMRRRGLAVRLEAYPDLAHDFPPGFADRLAERLEWLSA